MHGNCLKKKMWDIYSFFVYIIRTKVNPDVNGMPNFRYQENRPSSVCPTVMKNGHFGNFFPKFNSTFAGPLEMTSNRHFECAHSVLLCLLRSYPFPKMLLSILIKGSSVCLFVCLFVCVCVCVCVRVFWQNYWTDFDKWWLCGTVGTLVRS